MLDPGLVIAGDFEVLELLSEGGMGQVYRARQRSTQAERALKVMHPRWQERLAFRERFEREARLSALIESEHVVKVLAYGVEPVGGAPWIVMEYLRGVTLEQHVRKGPAATLRLQTTELLRQLFHGVAAAHREQIVHRDLKPSNVFIADSGRADLPFTVKVLDFGIAKQLSDSAAATEPLGTRAWMAPEQSDAAAVLTASVDVWALGLLVFWYLTGRSYFLHAEGDAAHLAFETHFAALEPASVRARLYGVGDLGAGFDRWFAACVARDPVLRFADAALAWQALLPELEARSLLSSSAPQMSAGTTLPLSDSSLGAPASSLQRVARAPATRLYNVPLPSSSFVGRTSELRELRTALLRDQPRVAVSIEGLPGIGKTELLLRLAHDLAHDGRFPGGIFWLPAESSDLAAAWASDAIASALGIAGGSIEERARRVVNALSDAQQPLLVILDNVERWSGSEQPQPLPLGVHVTLLASTRAHRLGGTRFRALPLGVLREGEARLLLTHWAGSRLLKAPGFDALLTALEGHTLAIELAGTYLSEFPEVTPAAYLAAMQAGQELAESAAEFTRYERTLSQAFRLLWQRLSEQTQQRWLLAAQFAPERVSAELADAAGLDAEARNALRRHHLIADSDGSFRMHRLTRQFALSAAEPGARSNAQDAFLSGVIARAKRIEIATGFRIYAPDRAHFEACVEMARGRDDSVTAAELFNCVATALHCIGELLPARALFELALERDLLTFGEDHAKVATLRSNLALLLQDLGELPLSRQLLERALASDLQHRSDNVEKILLRRSNLALLQQLARDSESARKMLQAALDEALPKLGEEHGMIAIARSNLCGILTDLGELDAAEALGRLALASDVKRYGESHPYAGIRRMRVAAVLEARGDRDGAIALLQHVVNAALANADTPLPRTSLAQARLA
ncbi:MAG: protein kinase, partial [Polyangiaceae bacterium]